MLLKDMVVEGGRLKEEVKLEGEAGVGGKSGVQG